MPRRLNYGVPTLKLNKSEFTNPDRLFQVLVDFSNDLQGFMQRAFSSINQNGAAVDALVNASKLIAAAGYTTLPSGIIIQWMLGSANNPGVSNALPRVFPSAIYAAFSGPQSAVAVAVTLTDTGHVTLTTPSAGAIGCFLAAIGK